MVNANKEQYDRHLNVYKDNLCRFKTVSNKE
jgi:hypothetical protein